MKCQVQWIDDKGQATPDENEAVMTAHFHTPVWGAPSEKNRIQGYLPEVRESFPICAEHYAMVRPSWRFPDGGWSFTPIAEAHSDSCLSRVIDPRTDEYYACNCKPAR